MQLRAILAPVLALSVLAQSAGLYAQPKRPEESTPAEDAVTHAARQAFLQGTALVKEGQWSEALSSFEKANAIKPSAVALFNIGYCHRALGHYVLAVGAFEKALGWGPGLSDTQRAEAHTYLQELQQLLVHLQITLDPPNARLAIDGRPLVPASPNNPRLLLAGVAPLAEAQVPPAASFEVLIDPGVHLLQATRPGHTTILLNKTLRAGAREQLPLKLDELPATVHIESDQPRAIVMVDDRDVGMAPIDVTRPAGRYRIQVVKKGFITYDSTLALVPGQRTTITARLTAEPEAITRKWWFWSTAAAVVVGGITATYFLTRPEQHPPPYDGGSLDWVAQPR